jgi:hypothetical protein
MHEQWANGRPVCVKFLASNDNPVHTRVFTMFPQGNAQWVMALFGERIVNQQ